MYILIQSDCNTADLIAIETLENIDIIAVRNFMIVKNYLLNRNKKLISDKFK